MARNRRIWLNSPQYQTLTLFIQILPFFCEFFLSFDEGTACLELMNRPDILDMPFNRGQVKGLAHLSISVGSREAVDELTRRLQTDGYTVIGQPRLTGDGFYESTILDPEGNNVEITE